MFALLSKVSRGVIAFKCTVLKPQPYIYSKHTPPPPSAAKRTSQTEESADIGMAPKAMI